MRFVARYRRELSVAAGLRGLSCSSWRRPPRGSSGPSQLRSFAVSGAPVLVAAVGMTLVILCRADRHLRSARSSRVCGVVAGLLAADGLPMPLVVAWRRSLAGAAMGAVNGALVAGLGLPSIVVTLATMVILREVAALVRARASSSATCRPDFQWFGAGAGRRAVAGRRDRGLVGVRRLRLGTAVPGGGAGGLRHRVGPRGRAARGHPAAAGRLRRVRR